MEKARLYCICRLLEITDRVCHQELLLSVKNLQEMGANLFPYIVPILPRHLPNEVIKGEHFILVDLLKSLPRGSSQEKAVPELLVRLDHLPLVVQDPKPAPKPTPQAAKKKKKKFGQAKATDEGPEGFVDWTNPKISESTLREKGYNV